MSDPEQLTGWPPEGFVAVGEYAFQPPNVPTLEQVEDAEAFIFTDESSLALDESHRRLNVVRLAIASTVEWLVPKVEGQSLEGFVPLLGGRVVRVVATRHEGSVVHRFSFIDAQDEN